MCTYVVYIRRRANSGPLKIRTTTNWKKKRPDDRLRAAEFLGRRHLTRCGGAEWRVKIPRGGSRFASPSALGR